MIAYTHTQFYTSLCQGSAQKNLSYRLGCILLFILLSLLLPSGRAHAGIILQDVVNHQDHQPGTYFWSGLNVWLTNYPIARSNGQDWGWTHSFIPPDPSAGVIVSATLTLEAYDIDKNELHVVNVGGLPQGTLVGDNNIMSTTVINLTSATFAGLADGLTDVWVNIGTQPSIGWVTIKSSTLTVAYGTPIPESSTLTLLALGILMYRRRITRRPY